MGERKTRDSVMLFMVPAMSHCLGEDYSYAPTTNFDAVTFIRRWKTTGKAPRQIVVTQTEKGEPPHQRLVCAYPAVERYKGTGSTEDPANEFFPSWSPEGRELAFVSNRTASPGVYATTLEGQERFVAPADGQVGAPSWVPSGKQVLFSVLPTSGFTSSGTPRLIATVRNCI